MEIKFPPLGAPSSLSRADDAPPRGDPSEPLGPAPRGSGFGYKEGWSLWSQRNPGARVPAGPPHPLRILSRGFTLLPASPHRPFLPPAQDPPDTGIRTKKPGCRGRARPRGAGEAGKYPRRAGRRAAHPPAVPAARARHAIPAVATPGRRRSCAPGPGPAGLALRTHRLRRARPGSGSLLGSAAAWDCVRRRVRAVRAGGARLAKSARDTGSVAHRPRVRVSQRETEGASYRGGEWGVRRGGCRDTLPHPAPRPPAETQKATRSRRHPDTKTSCQAQTQVSP